MGQCLAYPTDTRDLRRRNIVYFSGGVAVGFACAAASALALWLGAVPPGRLADFLLAWAWLGLVFNTLSLIPLGDVSDGFCLNVLRTPGPQADQFVATFTTQLLDMAGVRYRDIDRGLADALTQPACAPAWQLMGLNAAYLIAIDSGRLVEARTHLERLWELTAEYLARLDIELELAYFAADVDRDAVEARRHLDAAEGGGSPVTRVLAEAAICLAEGQPEAALAVLEPARPDFLAARVGTAMAQLITDQFEELSVRAGGSDRHEGI